MKRADYDSTLQMFKQIPQPTSLTHLAFLRYLAERDRLEHGVAGPSSGPLAPPVPPLAYAGKAS